jgi:predicted transcriptional regulator
MKCRSISQKEYFLGKKNPNYRGEKAKYQARHKWIYSHYGSINFCQLCFEKSINKYKYDWANISGEYKRDISDWVRLCRKCHKNFDKDYSKIGENSFSAKLKNEDIYRIRKCYKDKTFTIKELSNQYNLTFSTIYSIVKMLSWKHL